MKPVSLWSKVARWTVPPLISIFAALVSSGGCAAYGAQESRQVTPPVSKSQATPTDKQDLLRRLQEAEHADKMNSTSWSDTNTTLDTAYAIKAREVRRVIERIKRGETVSQREIDHALDNSRPHQLGGYP